jgi:hypothetical protein
VLSPDVVFEDFTHQQWMRLFEVFRPEGDAARAPGARASDTSLPEGGIVAVTTGTTLRKLVSTRRGRLDPRAEPWPESLAALAARHEARWAVEFSAFALDELMERFGDRLARGQDYLTQVLEFLRILRELEAERALVVYPTRISDWPLPSERAVLRAFDLLCAPGKCMVLGVFEAGELATCLVARRSARGFDRVIGPDALAGEMGLLSGDFRRDHRYLAAAVEREIGPISVGCYGEIGTFKRLSRGDEPGAWARAVAAQEVIVSPVTPGLALPLGIDAGRAAFRELRSLATRFGAGHWFSSDSPLAGAIGKLERPAWLDQDLRDFLGFDPWQLFVTLFSKTHRPP